VHEREMQDMMSKITQFMKDQEKQTSDINVQRPQLATENHQNNLHNLSVSAIERSPISQGKTLAKSKSTANISPIGKREDAIGSDGTAEVLAAFQALVEGDKIVEQQRSKSFVSRPLIMQPGDKAAPEVGEPFTANFS
jgi:hypothetical protein